MYIFLALYLEEVQEYWLDHPNIYFTASVWSILSYIYIYGYSFRLPLTFQFSIYFTLFAGIILVGQRKRTHISHSLSRAQSQRRTDINKRSQLESSKMHCQTVMCTVVLCRVNVCLHDEYTYILCMSNTYFAHAAANLYTYVCMYTHEIATH